MYLIIGITVTVLFLFVLPLTLNFFYVKEKYERRKETKTFLELLDECFFCTGQGND